MQALMTRARRGTPLRWLIRSLFIGAMLAAAAVAPIGAQETVPSPDASAPSTLTVGALTAVAVGIGIALRAYTRTQQP